MKVPLPLLLVVGIVGYGYWSSPPNGEAVDDAESKTEFVVPKTKNGVAKAHQPNADKPFAPAADANPVVAPKDRRGQQRIAVIDLERIVREDTDPLIRDIKRASGHRTRLLMSLLPFSKWAAANSAKNTALFAQLTKVDGLCDTTAAAFAFAESTAATPPSHFTEYHIAWNKKRIVQCKEQILQWEKELDWLFQRAGYSPADHLESQTSFHGSFFGEDDHYSFKRYSHWRLMRMQDAVAVIAKLGGYNLVLNFRPMQRRIFSRDEPSFRNDKFAGGPGGGAYRGFVGDAYSGLVVFQDKQDDITDLVIEFLKRE